MSAGSGGWPGVRGGVGFDVGGGEGVGVPA